MAARKVNNKFAELLKEQGNYVITVGGVDWYDYNGFMMPAYLPHCCPKISPQIAEEVVRISRRPFARWSTQFGQIENGEWWYILKRGPWSIEDIENKKKRWMIRQGKKNFSVCPLTFDEVVAECPRVAQSATARYKGEAIVESRGVLEARVRNAREMPGVLEYIGCFHENTLVCFSENYIQDNAVWLGIIRYDPAFLKKYSSYALMNGMLDYYLNEKNMDYVLDGSRRVYHRTEFQEHLVRVFNFSKEYAILNIKYSPKLGIATRLAYPFRSIVWNFCNKWANNTLDKVGAVLRQEYIRRACEKYKP